MSTTHLSLDGVWELCADEASCPSIYHLPDMSPAEAAVLPYSMMETLLEAVDPGKPWLGSKLWEDADGRLHRDYDLPAQIYPEGRRDWYQHGLRHRAGDKPAVIHPDGAMEWWEHGKRHRSSGGPAVVAERGLALWYRRDEYRHGYLHYPEFLEQLAAAQRAELELGPQPMRLPLLALSHGPLPRPRFAPSRMIYKMGLPFVDVVDLTASHGDWWHR